MLIKSKLENIQYTLINYLWLLTAWTFFGSLISTTTLQTFSSILQLCSGDRFTTCQWAPVVLKPLFETFQPSCL